MRRTWPLKLAIITLAVMAALLAVPTASAHPADMYYQIHTIELTPDGIAVNWSISPGPMLSFLVWDSADTDHDDEVTDAEARIWVEPVLADYLLVIDNTTPLTWQLESIAWPRDLVDFEVGTAQIKVRLTAAWPAEDGGGTHTVALYNRFREAISVNWFYLSAVDGAQFQVPQQQNGALLFDLVMPGATATADLHDYWDSGVPALAAGGEVVEPPSRDSGGAIAELTDILRSDDLSPMFYLTSFVIALGLGALHALTPGHGKALVGAYLVGARGTMKHAVALGSIVTLTHTGSVLTLGAITLAASHILMPTTIFPILEMASGLLVVGMGAGLLYRRYKAWRSVLAARERRARLAEARALMASGSAAATAIAAGGSGGGSGGGHRIQINQPIRVNVYNDVLPRDDFSLGSVNWRSLVTLGISGGLVPCPDAIAILLVAVAINRIVLGLSLIMAFSLGLAFILTAIGIAMVRSTRLLSRFEAFDRMVPAMPMFSALVVTGLGLVLTYNAIQRPGFLSKMSGGSGEIVLTVGDEVDTTDFAALRDSSDFALDEARIIYMDTDEANFYQLFVMDADGGGARAITAAPYGVWDFKLAPGEDRLVYAAPQEYGGSDLWEIDLDGGDPENLLTCSEAVCTRVTWSPDGSRLVYEQMSMPDIDTPVEITSLHWLDLESGESGPVFADSRLPSYNPAWSPDGRWISYVSPGASLIQLFNLATGESLAVPSRTGSVAMWSPDSRAVLVTDMWAATEGGQAFTHLMRFDLDTRETTDLTGPQRMGDTWPAWSPDGAWIAVVRRVYEGPNASLGDQVWLMKPDGSDAHPITAAPDVIHGLPVWAPDSRYLLLQRYTLAGSDASPGIILLDMHTGTETLLSASGTWPSWLMS